MIRRLVVAAVAVSVFVGLVPSAPAQEAEEGAVTLEANTNLVRWGAKVRLTGEVSTGEEGAEVRILDQDETVVAQAVTGEGGTFQTSFEPARNVGLRAEWVAVRSDPVWVRVKPIVKVNLYRVRLFGRALVTGNVKPALAGERVTLKLRRKGRVVAKKSVALKDGRFFKTRFRIRKPGAHTVRAHVNPADFAAAGKTSRRLSTPLPSLSVGSKSVYVKLLEQRLRQLGYYIPSANKSFDVKTRDALIAFTKVQRVARVGTVSASTWRRLASPAKPRPRFNSKFHIEIDQTRQVIFVVRNSKVRWILHTSTGKASTPTRNGVWGVWSKLAGYSRKRLYYPSFFDGGRAVHGWPEVPTYPASNGCARVPMWAATWIYGLMPDGATVRVYH